MSRKAEGERADIYTRITDRIVADLEKGVRPWMKPWNAANTEGRITRPLRHNGQPYSGMNVLLL
jgi:antirestriction protein ArdC